MIVKLDNLIVIRRDLIDDMLSPNGICKIFDEFLIEFERMERSKVITVEIFLDAVEEIIDAVLSISPHKLLSPTVLYHPVMHFLHQVLITKLNKWCMLHLHLNSQETDILLKTVLIFVHAAEHAPVINTDEDQQRIKGLSAIKQFLFQIREQIDSMVLQQQNFNHDTNISALGLLTINLLEGYPFYYSMGTEEHLVTDCKFFMSHYR
jgi:hypothetical protein